MEGPFLYSIALSEPSAGSSEEKFICLSAQRTDGWLAIKWFFLRTDGWLPIKWFFFLRGCFALKQIQCCQERN